MCLCCSCSKIFSCFRIGFGGTFVKWVIILANILFSVLGLVFIMLGFLCLIIEKLLSWWPWAVNMFAIPLITTGCAIYVVTTCGCCGALKEWRCLIAMYTIVMFALVVAQGYLVVVTWGKVDQVENITATWVREVFNMPLAREPFHILEATMACCGADGKKSYEDLNQKLPASCCKEPYQLEGSQAFACHSGDAYKGCVEQLPPYLQKLSNIVGSSIYYVIGLELLAAIAGSYLFRALSPKTKRG